VRTNNNGGKRESTSLTWADVRHLQEQMTGHLQMRVDVVLSTPADLRAGKLFEVRVRAFAWEDAWGKPVHQVASYWPHPACATMPGLIVRLFHQLDHMSWHQEQLPGVGEA